MNKIMRILITHANTPYFNKNEQEVFEKRFVDILKYVDQLNLPYSIRSTNTFVQQNGTRLGSKFDNERPIQKLVAEYDAVISTPSTVLLPFLEMHVPIMQVVIRPGPPMIRSAYMSFCEHDDEGELLKMYHDRKENINVRLEMQNKVFRHEYAFGANSEKAYAVSPLAEVDARFKQFNRTVSTFIYILGIFEMFMSSIKALIKRKRF